MIGSTLSHYRILEELVRGGMEVVYMAEDTKLERMVELKVLPKHLVDDEGAKRRFAQEARAASRLEHQNICSIQHVDETGDGEFYISPPGSERVATSGFWISRSAISRHERDHQSSQNLHISDDWVHLIQLPDHRRTWSPANWLSNRQVVSFFAGFGHENQQGIHAEYGLYDIPVNTRRTFKMVREIKAC